MTWHSVPPLEKWNRPRSAHLSVASIRGGENHAATGRRISPCGPVNGPSAADVRQGAADPAPSPGPPTTGFRTEGPPGACQHAFPPATAARRRPRTGHPRPRHARGHRGPPGPLARLADPAPAHRPRRPPRHHRPRRRAGARRAAAAEHLRRLEPNRFARIPAEAVVGAVLLLRLPRAARLAASALFGTALGALTVLNLLDMGFTEYLGGASTWSWTGACWTTPSPTWRTRWAARRRPGPPWARSGWPSPCWW